MKTASQISFPPAPGNASGLVRRLAPRLLLAVALGILLSALWAGLVRLGWRWPVLQASLPAVHGPLMAAGFLGALIALERAVALQKPWAYAAPLFNGFGGLALGVGLVQPGQVLLALGALGLLAVLVAILRRQAAGFTLLLALGGAALLGGNLLWLSGRPAPLNVLWWAGFLLLTIAGERLELGRLRRLSQRTERLLLGLAAAYLLALAVTLIDHGLGVRLAGLAMLGMAGWLWHNDLARRTVRRPGLPRFAALSLLSGYLWLGLAGGLAVVYGGVTAGFLYDALLHSFFLGFTFSMIFGHAPIILPAIARQAGGPSGRASLPPASFQPAADSQPVIFHPALYTPLILLHLSLGVRVGGDLLANMALRLWGGLFNALAILLFLGLVVFLIMAGKKSSVSS